jgi:hypothetical protein
MELKSPDGKTTVVAHPSKVESMLAKGWTSTKLKSTPEVKVGKKAKAEEIQDKESE